MKMPHKLPNIILEVVALNAIALGLVIGTASISAFAADDDGMDWKSPLAAEFSKLDTSGNGLLKANEATKGHAFNKQTFAKADADHDGSIDQDEYIFFKTGQWPKDTQSTVQNNGMQGESTQENMNDSPDKIIENNPTGAGMPDSPNSNLKLDNDLSTPDSNMLDNANPDSANPNQNGTVPSNPDQAMPDSSTRGSIEELSPPTVAVLDHYTQQVKFQTSESVSKDNYDGKAIDDNVINTKAIATILDTDELEGIEISVETHQGEVLLDGFVRSEQDKMKTEYVVSMIDGVKSVKNYLKIRS
ncbi:MAG: BON domain-containing protein [Methylotenera sp.]|nr:BON domain-containing protein [Methylotenera sp.]